MRHLSSEGLNIQDLHESSYMSFEELRHVQYMNLRGFVKAYKINPPNTTQ